MEKDVRAHVVITGRVQGVFFRAETQKMAQSIGLYGYVRNKSDGSVEAVFEGPREIVDKALEWCRKGPPMSEVLDIEVEWKPSAKAYDVFTITY